MTMLRSRPTGACRFLGGLLGGLLLLAVAYFAAFHVRFVTLAGPQEVREAAVPLITRLILHHGAPYTLDTLPVYSDIYGIVYNYAVLPAAMIWGPTFSVHRAASLVFLVIGAAFIYVALRRESAGRGLALAGAAFFYLINGATYAIVSRPDTLGDALFLAIFLLALPSRGAPPSRTQLALSAALGVLAFYTKPYFILGAGLAVAGLCVTAGWRKAAGYLLAVGAIFLATIPLVNHFWPYYLFSIFWVNWYSSLHADGFFIKQLTDFLLLHAGLLGALVFLAVASRRHTGGTEADAPLLPWRDPWTIGLVCSVIFVLVLLGNHAGAFRTYWTQLVTPFLIVVTLRAVARAQGRARAWGLGLLACNAYIMLSWARLPWPADTAPAWEEWHNFTANRPWQLLPPHATEDIQRFDGPLLDNGQMIYFANAALNHLPPGDPAQQRVRTFAAQAAAWIVQRRFDLIVSPNDFKFYISEKLLEEHYEPWHVEFPIYFLHYDEPQWYGAFNQEFTAWVRKPGPEHAHAPLP